MNYMLNRMNCCALVLMVAMAGSCKTNKSTTAETPKQEPAATNPRIDLPDSMYRVVVSFISIGAGTDEGEVDFCFKLLGQDKKSKDSFVQNLRDAFKGNNLVQITENTPALHQARPAFGK